jgi:hypothetical protein
MTINNKGRTGCNQSPPQSSKYRGYFISPISRLKAVVITLALWGWLPLALAEWLEQRGGDHHE